MVRRKWWLTLHLSCKVFAEVPPKVEYSLTSLGRSLGPVFDKIYEWGVVYLRSVKRAETTKNGRPR